MKIVVRWQQTSPWVRQYYEWDESKNSSRLSLFKWGKRENFLRFCFCYINKYFEAFNAKDFSSHLNARSHFFCLRLLDIVMTKSTERTNRGEKLIQKVLFVFSFRCKNKAKGKNRGLRHTKKFQTELKQRPCLF